MEPANLSSQDVKRILVVSKNSILAEGVKLLVGEAVSCIFKTALNNRQATHLINEFKPETVILDRPKVSVKGLDNVFLSDEFSSKVIVIGWGDDKLAVYTRQGAKDATVQNLIEAITDK